MALSAFLQVVATLIYMGAIRLQIILMVGVLIYTTIQTILEAVESLVTSYVLKN